MGQTKKSFKEFKVLKNKSLKSNKGMMARLRVRVAFQMSKPPHFEWSLELIIQMYKFILQSFPNYIQSPLYYKTKIRKYFIEKLQVPTGFSSVTKIVK